MVRWEAFKRSMLKKIKEYRELKRLTEEIHETMKQLEEEIKEGMNGQEELIIGEYKITYKEAKRETLDKKRLIQDIGDLGDYMNITTYKQFRIS